MSSDELVIESNAAQIKAYCEAEIEKAMQQASMELAEAPWPSDWEVWAYGPFQAPGQAPGRIIEINQPAYIATIVWLNPFMNTNVASFGGEVQLNYHTANTQTMSPVADPAFAHYSCCFAPNAAAGGPFGAFYVTVWEFTPTEAGCILETNICARLCNCNHEAVPGYAAFVRWVANLDFDSFFPPVGYQLSLIHI